jgi:hypothetical protein
VKNYEVNYDVVSAAKDDQGRRLVLDVASKRVKINDAADDLDVQGAVAALENKDREAIVITALSSAEAEN